MFTKISVFLVIFSLFSCNQNRQKSIEEPVLSTEERLQNRFLNQQLESVNTVLFDGKTVDDKKVILIYTGFDCSPCVDKGFLILKTVQSQNENQKINIVATSANIGRDQERNEFYDLVYSDNQELIRTELKFLYTPVILVLDRDNRIIHLNFPKTNSNEREMVEQINHVISK